MPDSFTPSAAVGSSMNTTRLANAALARRRRPSLPPDSVSTGWPIEPR